MRWPGRPPEGRSEGLGIFTSLGGTELLAVEQDGGVRDGHEYWYHARGWVIHVRWFGLQWVFTHIRNRRDKRNIRKTLEDGELIFDKANVAPMLTSLAVSGRIYEHLAAREVYRFRIELAEIIDTLDGLFALPGRIEPEHLAQLCESYRAIIAIAEEAAPLSEDQVHAEIASRITRAGKSRVEFSGAIMTLRDLAELLIQRFGGKPRREYYTPASALQFMPPDPTGKPHDEIDMTLDESLCTACGRRFFVQPKDAPPVLSAEPESAPEIFTIRAGVHEVGAQGVGAAGAPAAAAPVVPRDESDASTGNPLAQSDTEKSPPNFNPAHGARALKLSRSTVTNYLRPRVLARWTNRAMSIALATTFAGLALLPARVVVEARATVQSLAGESDTSIVYVATPFDGTIQIPSGWTFSLCVDKSLRKACRHRMRTIQLKDGNGKNA